MIGPHLDQWRHVGRGSKWEEEGQHVKRLGWGMKGKYIPCRRASWAGEGDMI